MADRKAHYEYFVRQCDRIKNHMSIAENRNQLSQLSDLRKKLEHYEAAAFALRPHRSILEAAREDYRNNG